MSQRWQVPVIPARDPAAEDAARERQDGLLKPRGSLGRLESLAVDLAGMTGTVPGDAWPPAILVFAADHGVATENRVSAYPQEVTVQMVRSYAAGVAAINVLAALRGSRLRVVDVGVITDLPELPGVSGARVRAGSRDLTRRPALTRAEVERALCVGAAAAEEEIVAGAGLLALGEMGIGNTTAASAVVAGLTGAAPEAVTGRGSGVGPAGRQVKVDAVRTALQRLGGPSRDPRRVLGEVGGIELVSLVGAMLAAAARRVPVLLDGFITGAAALAAVGFRPRARDYLIAAHRSPEPGHDTVLEELAIEPLLDLGMRLGEASGAALALSLVEAAIRLHHDTATFEEAGVSGRSR